MVSAFITTRFSATSYKDQAKPQSYNPGGEQRCHFCLLVKRQQQPEPSTHFRLSQEVSCVEAKVVFDQTESESGILLTPEVWNLA